jgi:HSP20 family protein
MLNRIPTMTSFPRVSEWFDAMLSDTLAPARINGPAMNVWENQTAYFIEAELPGFHMEDIDVSVLGDVVTIKGQRKLSQPENAMWLRRERTGGSFTRTWTLPNAVEVDKVEASLTNGVLLVTLPKTPAVQPRRISVKSGS